MVDHLSDRPRDGAIRVADPRDLILDSPLSRAQKHAIALTAALSALDGFDLLSVTFVVPRLAQTFQVDSAVVGVLLSAGLVGALVGSVALAPLADTIGRKPVVLINLALLTAGMLLSALSSSVLQLTLTRLLTGVGIGAMLVVVNPIAAEVANRRLRSFAIAMMGVGFPLGGACGGLIAAFLLRHFDWPSVFVFGAILSLLLTPLVVRYLPESLAFLLTRRRENSLERVNALLRRFGHPPLAELPPVAEHRAAPYREVFRGGQLARTLTVSAVGFLMYMTIYFFLSWQPTILVRLGFNVPAAATVAGASSVAGAAACIAFGLVSRRVAGRVLATVSMLGLGGSVVVFGLVPPQPALLVIVALIAGGCVSAATVGLLVTAANAFPAPVRATGTGLVLGVGRVGSALAPALAGTLFAAGGDRATVASIMGVGAVLAGAILLARPRTSPPA